MRKSLAAVIIVIVLALLSGPALAEMYKWVDKNGVVHYSDTPPVTPEKDVETIETPRYAPPSPKPDSKQSRATEKEASKSEPKKSARTKEDILGEYADKVVIFTKNWCPYCKKAVAFLQANRIRFEEYDVEKDAKAAKTMRALGGRGGVPYAIIKGKAVYGFSEGTYKKALGLR